MRYASFWRRLAAALIDSTAVNAGAYVLGAVVGATGFSAGAAEEGVKAVAFVLGVLFSLAYSVLFTGLVGQTPGKMAVGIKVVLADGRVPQVGGALLREVPGQVPVDAGAVRLATSACCGAPSGSAGMTSWWGPAWCGWPPGA